MFKKNLRILLSRLFFILSALVAIYFLPQMNGYLSLNNDPFDSYLFWIWSNFGGQHFLSIVSLGYINYDFFYLPFYPTLIHFISFIIPIKKLEITFLISLSSFFISSFFIYKITKLDLKKYIISLTLLLKAQLISLMLLTISVFDIYLIYFQINYSNFLLFLILGFLLTMLFTGWYFVA